MQGLPLAPGPEAAEEGSPGPTSIAPWPVAPEGLRLQWREHRREARPQCVGSPPSAPPILLGVTPGVGSYGSEVFRHRLPEHNLMG